MTSRSIGAGSDRGSGPLSRQLRTLFAAGSFAGLADGELLERYLDRGRSRPSADAEAAFAALVDRHGPMVRRSCRAILGNAADADDAFQGVFLLLARKARSLRSRETVAPWLVETCRRVCRKLLVSASRRRSHEARASLPADAPTTDLDPASLEDRAVLLDEIDRLPPSFRAPMLLCGLEGRTAADASRLLGVAEGTIHSRLSRARALLRSRLSRRGLAFVPLPITRVPPFLPERLVTAAVRNASLLSAGRLAAIEAPAAVLSLIVSTSRRTLMHSTLLLSLVSAVSLGPIAAGWAPAPPSVSEPILDSPAVEEEKTGPFHIEVIEFDGTPAAGALVKVRAPGYRGAPGYRDEFRADEDGRIVVPERPQGLTILATREPRASIDGDSPAVGYRQNVFKETDSGEPEAPVQVVVRGLGEPVAVRVIDEQGVPVEGVEVVVRSARFGGETSAPDSGYVRPRAEDSRELFGTSVTDAGGLASIRVPRATTFDVAAEAPGLTSGLVLVRGPDYEVKPIVVHLAGSISGTVTDAETGATVPGVVVRSRFADHSGRTREMGWTDARTDADGRYVLQVAPGIHEVEPVPGKSGTERARVVRGVRVEPLGLATADLTIARTHPVSGQIISAADGSPIARQSVIFVDPGDASREWVQCWVDTDAEGRFSLRMIEGTYSIGCPLGRVEYVGPSLTFNVSGDNPPGPLTFEAEVFPDPPTSPPVPVDAPKFARVYAIAAGSVGLEVIDHLAWSYWGAQPEVRVIRGRITDEEGRPLAGVEIRPVLRDERRRIERGERPFRPWRVSLQDAATFTDRQGRFVLKDSAPGPRMLGFWRALDEVGYGTVAPEEDEVEFVLSVRP